MANIRWVKWLLLFVLIPFVAPVVSYVFFWRTVSGTPHIKALHYEAGGNLSLCIAHVIIRSIIAQSIALLSLPLGFFKRLHQPSTFQEGPIVLLVHGLYHSAGGWILFRSRLKEGGINNIYAITYDSWRRNIPELAEELGRTIASIKKDHQEKPLFIVGHSMGGLLLRVALSNPMCAEKVAAVVTLGTPHGGSTLARMGIGPAARGLLPDSETMTMVRSLPVPTLPWLCIISYFDSMVLPLENLFPPQGAPWSVYSGGAVGHVDMLYDRFVAHAAISFLKKHSN